MPYIGQRPSKGDENNFKILDDISSYTLTFDGSDSSVVSAANDTITSLTHRFVQGQRVTYNKGGGTVIAGLSDGVYFIIKEDHNTIKLATSASNATNGIAVNITGVGGGSSHTLNVAFDGVNTKFKATHTNGQKTRITRSAQLVISINGVIQQPHDTATPSTGFGFDLDGTIVLSQAPVAGDEYWAHVLTNNNVTFDISNNDIDNFTGNGSTVSFNLSKTPPDNRNVLVTIDGVIQYPNDPNGTVRSYTVVENVLTFVTAPASGVEIQVRHIGFAGSTSGSGGVTSFYGRTGAVVLKNTDNIVANNAEFAGNLTVQGTMTTLDTKVTEVDQLEVAANNTTVGVAITQSGTGDIIKLYDGSSQVLSVSDGGQVLIGTTDAGHSSADDLTINNSGNGGITIRTGTTSNGAIFFADGTSGDARYDGFVQYNHGASPYMMFGTAGDERVRITNGGNLKLPDDAKIELGGGQTGTGDLQIYHDPNNSFIKNNTGTLNIQSDTVRLTDVALAHVYVKGTASATELYHDNNLKLSTSSTGISITGIPVATQSTGNIGLELHATGSGRGSQTKYHNDHGVQYVGTAGDTTGNLLIWQESNANIFFATNNTERLRIDSSGRIGVNYTPGSGDGIFNVKVDGTNVLHIGHGTNKDNYFTCGASGMQVFRAAGTERLRITSTGDLSLRTTTQNAYLGLTANSTAINTTLGSTSGTNPRLYLKGVGNGQSDAGDVFIGSGTGGIVQIRSAELIKFEVNSDNSTTEALRIHADGEVEIKEAAAGQTVLSMRGLYSTGNHVDIATFARSGGAVKTAIRYNDPTTSMMFGTTTSHHFGIMTGGAEKLRIESGGGLKFTGKGTSIPVGGILHHTNNNLYVRGGTSGLVLGNQDNTNTIHISDSNFIKFETNNGTERVRIDLNGNMQVSTGQFTVGTTATTGLQFINDGTFGTLHSANLTFRTVSATRMTLDTSGRLLINTTTNRDKYFNGTYTGQLQVEGTNDATRLSQFIFNNSGGGGHILVIGKSRGSTTGSYDAVVDTNYLGTISFQGADGNEMVDAARIEVQVNGTPSDDNMPADMIFRTNSGSVSPTERLRIPKTGGIKLSNTGGGNLLSYGGSTVKPNAAINIVRYGTGYADIRIASNYGAGISFAGASDNTDEYRISQDNQKNAYHNLEYDGFINFVTNNNEQAMRLQDGKVAINKYLETLTGNGFNAALQVSNKTTDGYGTIMMGGGYNRATIGIGANYDLIITSNAYPANATSNGIIFKTGSDGGGGPHERLRIKSSGQIRAIDAGFDSRWGDTLDVTIDTASWAADTFYRVVNDNVFDNSNDTYLVWFKWSHDGSGAPWIITGNFLWTPTGANVNGAASPVFTPVQSAHNSTATISFQGVAGGNVRQGLQARADGWNPSGGDLIIKASKIGHPYA